MFLSRNFVRAIRFQSLPGEAPAGLNCREPTATGAPIECNAYLQLSPRKSPVDSIPARRGIFESIQLDAGWGYVANIVW